MYGAPTSGLIGLAEASNLTGPGAPLTCYSKRITALRTAPGATRGLSGSLAARLFEGRPRVARERGARGGGCCVGFASGELWFWLSFFVGVGWLGFVYRRWRDRVFLC